MISRRSSDRTARTDLSQRRPTVRRGIKKRGILPSFGDIVLPIVSVAAIGLLVLAGRQFFLNGIKTSPGISSTRAYAEAPALIAERERKQERESEVSIIVPIASERNENPSLDMLVKQEEKPSEVQVAASVMPETSSQRNVNVSQPKVQPKQQARTQPKAQPKQQPSKPQPAKTQPAKTQPTKTQPAKTQSAKTQTAKTQPEKTSSTPSSKQWRVQIGAYTSKTGAQEAANKLKKAGYNAVVYSNPASKHHKVWVSGGADKKSAERIVNTMKKLGYGSSFAFPPSK